MKVQRYVLTIKTKYLRAAVIIVLTVQMLILPAFLRRDLDIRVF